MELVSLSCHRNFTSASCYGLGWYKYAIATQWYQFHTTDAWWFSLMNSFMYVDVFLIGTWGTNFSEILIAIHIFSFKKMHYNDIIMILIASQITSLMSVYSTVYSDADQKKTSKLRVTGLCAGNSPGTSEFPAQRASNAESVSIWWLHHGIWKCHLQNGARFFPSVGRWVKK